MSPGPHRRTIGAPIPEPPAPRRPVYRQGVRSHDPYRHHQRYDVPQINGRYGTDDVALADGPIRVVAIVDRYPPLQNAGAEWMLHHLLRDTRRRGHEAIVCTATPQPYRLEGVQVVPHRQAAEYAATADVLIGHLMWTREVVEAAAKYQRPLLYLVHNDAQLHHWKLTTDNITLCVWNSRWISGASGARWTHGGTGQGVLVRPPVLIDDYAMVRDPWTAPYVTLVNPNIEKGSSVFYELARRPPGRRYLAVEGAYGNQVLPGRDTPNVDWQPQTGDMVRDVYARTRVLVVPSKFESWGRVAVEAMSSGIPVVAAPTEGLLESCGHAAIYVDWLDIDGWQDALDSLDDPDIYAERSMASYQRASELTVQSFGDIDIWDHALRACAAANPARPQPSPAPSPRVMSPA